MKWDGEDPLTDDDLDGDLVDAEDFGHRLAAAVKEAPAAAPDAAPYVVDVASTSTPSRRKLPASFEDGDAHEQEGGRSEPHFRRSRKTPSSASKARGNRSSEPPPCLEDLLVELEETEEVVHDPCAYWKALRLFDCLSDIKLESAKVKVDDVYFMMIV